VATVRPAAVAGSFYPGDAKALRAVVYEHLDGARASFAPASSAEGWPKALIVPHAGYMYSGPVAASAYLTLEPGVEIIDRIVLLGPSHHVPFDGIAVPSNTAFETPLGAVPIDETSRRRALALGFVETLDDAHHWEHSLEVQLPFLQVLLDTFAVLPMAIGRATPEQVRELLDTLWGGDETVIIISSDLSHYHGYAIAKRMDAATAQAIESLAPERIGHADACGRVGVQGLLESARAHSLRPTTLDLRSSGDTAGGRAEVVGYGAWAFTASKNGSP
jgi:AmmeMemoRadiSam system protein B